MTQEVENNAVESWAKVPTVYANHCAVVVNPVIVRVVFAEGYGTDKAILARTAIALVWMDAEIIAHKILAMMEQFRQEQAKAAKQAEANKVAEPE